MIGVLLNLLLGLSRVMLAMARRGDMPHACGRVSSRTATPRPAVIGVACLIGLLVCMVDSLCMVIEHHGTALLRLDECRRPSTHRGPAPATVDLGARAAAVLHAGVQLPIVTGASGWPYWRRVCCGGGCISADRSATVNVDSRVGSTPATRGCSMNATNNPD